MNVVFVLGSHVRHVGIALRDRRLWSITWGPLCRQLRPANDGNGVPWRIASTPAQHARPVCTRCVREVGKIAGAVL